MQEARLRQALESAIQPTFLDLSNESHGHRVPKGSETHFRAVIVSDAFEGLSRVKRHQLVYQAAADALASGVHALAMQCFTPDEWSNAPERLVSPACHSGPQRDPA